MKFEEIFEILKFKKKIEFLNYFFLKYYNFEFFLKILKFYEML
jgi:hypothetical protein